MINPIEPAGASANQLLPFFVAQRAIEQEFGGPVKQSTSGAVMVFEFERGSIATKADKIVGYEFFNADGKGYRARVPAIVVDTAAKLGLPRFEAAYPNRPGYEFRGGSNAGQLVLDKNKGEVTAAVHVHTNHRLKIHEYLWNTQIWKIDLKTGRQELVEKKPQIWRLDQGGRVIQRAYW